MVSSDWGLVARDRVLEIGEALRSGASRLPGDAPRLDAEVWLAHVLGRPRAWLLTHSEAPLSEAQQAEFERGLERLAGGEPLAYLTGQREFFGLDFFVNPHVLVPRPETELLVEHALRVSKSRLADNHFRLSPSAFRLADVGTGSGCIAVSLAVHLPQAAFVATDLSPQALAVARRNAERHGVSDRIDFRQGDLLQPLAGPVDLLCANLPYIAADELAGLDVSRHEPPLALDGGRGGLTLVKRLLAEVPPCLKPGGILLLEVGATQGPAAAAQACAAFPDAAVSVHQDLAGLDRLLVVELSAPISNP
jgi:release factor glutamine methyltransferase